MSKRAVILAGMAGGVLWAVALPILADPLLGWLGDLDAVIAWAWAAFAPGLVLIAMVGRLAQRRFFDDTIIDGQPFAAGSAAEIDQKVLSNTVEQLVLAAAIWPLVAWRLGAPYVVLLGLSFAATRVLFWLGYHVSPPLRGFGFAASFYPTILAALLVLWSLRS